MEVGEKGGIGDSRKEVQFLQAAVNEVKLNQTHQDLGSFLWRLEGRRVASQALLSEPGQQVLYILVHSSTVLLGERNGHDFCFRGKSWTDTPRPTGGFPPYFVESGILKIFNPSLSNLKHPSSSKSKTILRNGRYPCLLSLSSDSYHGFLNTILLLPLWYLSLAHLLQKL